MGLEPVRTFEFPEPFGEWPDARTAAHDPPGTNHMSRHRAINAREVILATPFSIVFPARIWDGCAQLVWSY